ncbi:MAG: DNA polymerase, partial [Planctomycetota bacterium]
EINTHRKNALDKTLNVRVTPERIFLKNIPANKNINIKKESGRTIKIENFSDDKCINFCLNLKNIWEAIEGKLIEKQKKLYSKIELPLSVVLANMEKTGILVDKRILNNLETTFKEDLKELSQEIYRIAGTEFNIDSPKQLQVILYEKLKIKPGKKTKTGFSTDQDELIRISNLHPIGSKLLRYRIIAKLLNTYVESFGKYIRDDNRVHTTFIQGGTITGRLSTQEPNLQNIPARTEEGKKIRAMFIASEGYKLLSLDYSQIELRVLAHLSGEEKLIDAFKQNRDIHTQTACTLFGKKEEEITENMRRFAKTINFGIIYGLGAHALSEQLGISHSEAREFIESFFKNYPKIKQYIDNQIAIARNKLFVENIFGRIRYIREIRSENFHEKSAAERIAINTPIQGTAADITKLGMINLYTYFRKNNIDASLLLQIHDEILIEYNHNYREDFIEKCKSLMSNIEGLNFQVPLLVKSSTGTSWGEL